MIKSKRHFQSATGIPFDVARGIATNASEYYYEVIKKRYKEDGTPRKPRILHPSTGELKRIQAHINDRILSKIELLPIAFGGVKGKSNLNHGKFHQGNKYKFETDLQDFFPSIQRREVYLELLRSGFSRPIALLLTDLTTYQGFVPQGAPTSTTIANIAHLKVDKRLSEFCSPLEIKYSRFVDDLFFSAQSDFTCHHSEIINIILKSSFKIGRQKTKASSGIAKTTGVLVQANKLGVPFSIFDKREALDKNDPKFTARSNGYQNYINRIEKINAQNNERKY